MAGQEEVTILMPPLVATVLNVLLRGTEAAKAIDALIKMSQGVSLETHEHTALGMALELAHKRLLTPRGGIPMTIPTPPPAPPTPISPAS